MFQMQQSVIEAGKGILLVGLLINANEYFVLCDRFLKACDCFTLFEAEIVMLM